MPIGAERYTSMGTGHCMTPCVSVGANGNQEVGRVALAE